jgi:hypothetical protein
VERFIETDGENKLQATIFVYVFVKIKMVK